MLIGYITKIFFGSVTVMIIFITIIFVQMLIFILFPYVNIIFLYLVKYLVINKENNLELEKRKKIYLQEIVYLI